MAVNQEPQVFLFLSELVGRKVLDPEGQPLGTLLDLTGGIGEIYPPVTGVLVMLEYSKRPVFIPWSQVSESNGTLTVRQAGGEEFGPAENRAGEPYLCETLLDKQVVDTDGAKVRRDRKSVV